MIDMKMIRLISDLRKFDSEVYYKLQQAEQEAALTGQRYFSKDVLAAMRDAIKEE